MTDDGPRRISDREVEVSIAGYFMPTHEPNVPVLIGMPGTDDLFMFVFSTEDKLRSTMESLGIDYERIVQVTDGGELIEDVAAMNASGERSYRIRLAVDPHRADNGRVRFVEPQLDAPPAAPPPRAPSALATMRHTDGCSVVQENGVAVWMCVGDCPAMHEFIRSGQVDHQPWDQLDETQAETVKRAVLEHALCTLEASDAGDEGRKR